MTETSQQGYHEFNAQLYKVVQIVPRGWIPQLKRELKWQMRKIIKLENEKNKTQNF